MSSTKFEINDIPYYREQGYGFERKVWFKNYTTRNGTTYSGTLYQEENHYELLAHNGPEVLELPIIAESPADALNRARFLIKAHSYGRARGKWPTIEEAEALLQQPNCVDYLPAEGYLPLVQDIDGNYALICHDGEVHIPRQLAHRILNARS